MFGFKTQTFTDYVDKKWRNHRQTFLHFRFSLPCSFHSSAWSQSSSFHFPLTLLPWTFACSLLVILNDGFVVHVEIFLIKSFDKHQSKIRIINMREKLIKRLVASFIQSYFYVFMFPFSQFAYFCKCFLFFMNWLRMEIDNNWSDIGDSIKGDDLSSIFNRFL